MRVGGLLLSFSSIHHPWPRILLYQWVCICIKGPQETEMISTGSLFRRFSTLKGTKHATDFLLRRRKVTFCVGLLGGLAESSVVAREGNTVVHAAITTERLQAVNDSSILPLTIDYRDRSYAHGRVPMTPTRRDKSNTDEEVLAARVIDRSVL